MDAGLQYWQQLGQQEQENEEALEVLRWHEQQRDLLNNLNSENDHEYSDFDFGRIRGGQVNQPAQS